MSALAVMGHAALAGAQSSGVCAAHEHAQALAETGSYLQAREELLACINSNCAAEHRRRCAAMLQRFDDVMPSVAIRVHDSQGNDLVAVTVRVDGVVLATELSGLALPVDPGRHSFTFEHVDYPVVTRELQLERGAQFVPVEVELVSPPPPPAEQEAPLQPPTVKGRDFPWRRAVGWTLLGVGAAAGAGALVVGSSARDAERNLDDTCRPDCSSAAVDAMVLRYRLSNVALGVGVLAVGSGLWAVLSANESDEGVADAPVSADLGRHHGQLVWTTHF